MTKKKSKWIEIETLKDGTPNIASSFRKLKEMNIEKEEKTKDGRKPRKIYACVYCGRIYKSAYRLMGHIGHCDKRKLFRKRTREGMEFRIGGKIFEIKTTKIKVLKTAEGYETLLRGKVKNGEMTIDEAERLFFVFLKGAQSAISVGSVQYTMKDIESDKGEKEIENEKEPSPLPPSTPIPPEEKEKDKEKEDIE
jgi:hypothetical protein